MKYTITAEHNIARYCPTCAAIRLIYQTEDGAERLTCCGSCQRVHLREKIAVAKA